MTRVAHWGGGEATLWRVAEEWLAGGAAEPLTADNPRRRLARLRTARGEIALKRFLPQPGLQKRIDTGRRWLALSPARREWAALSQLHAAGARVPEPLAHAVLQDGGELLALSYVSARPLVETLDGPHRDRRRVLMQLGVEVARLHASGWVHRDLHVGNVVVDAEDRPVLLDFQRARRSRRKSERERDLGDLDFSLRRAGYSLTDRLRFRLAALGAADLRDTRDVHPALARVGAASLKREQRHYQSRTRRCLRPGRRYARIEIAARRGLCTRGVSYDTIARALEIHAAVHASEGELARRGTSLKRDHRSRVTAAEVDGNSLIVKEVVKQGLGRLLADSLRGSPARRAWVAGHGLRARGIRAATPIAFLERRRAFVPVASTLVMEDVRPATPAHEFVPEQPAVGEAPISPADLAAALRRLALDLHRTGVVHGDLQGPHIYLTAGATPEATSNSKPGAERLACILIDLEGVRFRSRVSDAERIQSLAELNASLPDPLLDADERRDAFERYSLLLRFGLGEGNDRRSQREAAKREIVRRSLARGHLWKGDGCEEGPPPGSSDDSGSPGSSN